MKLKHQTLALRNSKEKRSQNHNTFVPQNFTKKNVLFCDAVISLPETSFLFPIKETTVSEV